MKADISDPTLSMQRIQLIKATQNLGIDRKSLSSFLKNAIDIEEKALSIMEPVISEHELYRRRRDIMQADLIRLILDYF